MVEKTSAAPLKINGIGAHEFRKKLFLGLIGSAIISSLCLILPSGSGDKTFYSDIIAIITSGSAFTFAVQVIYRQRLKTIFGKLYASVGLGLCLWFAAEAIWSYYELVEGIETPFPSIADVFWLSGYIPLGYFLFGILRQFAGSGKRQLIQTLLISSIAIVILTNILLSIYRGADLSTNDGILLYLVSSAYPISDMILIVPAIASFLTLRKGQLTFTPWALFTIATILFIVGDTGFGLFTIIGGMDELTWIWNPFYNIGYLAIANALFWHKHFFTIDEKKLLKEWQMKNR